MLRRTLISASTVLAVAPNALLAASTIGQTAPDFTLADVTGKTVKLSGFLGQHVVLEWTNPGCPFVRKHYDGGNMQATQVSAMARGVVWLAVNSTDKSHYDYLEPGKLAAWMAQRRSSPSAMLMDEEGRVGRAYGARTTPHMFIIDPQGRLIYAGGIDSIASARSSDTARATNYVNVALGEALAGKPLSAAQTPPYGCSVKYKS
jgi:alkyl hydroperoxide reductase subunit AhpC